MADLSPLNFAPETTEDAGDGFKVVPPGTYPVVIVKSDVIDAKSGAGNKVLVLECQILEGPETGDIIVDRLNIKNTSEVSQKIGLSQLKNICEAIGYTGQLKDSAQLHGKPYSIKVVVEDFTSNKTGKKLNSNKVEKRMPRKELMAGSMPTAPATGTTKTESRPWG